MKTVLITGASGNLGLAVTRYFLEKGHTVIATVTSTAAQAELGEHNRLFVQVVDLMNEEATTTFVKTVVEKYTRIDAALLLVGGFAMGNIQGTTGTDIDRQLSLNFKTAYFVTRPLFAHMMEKGNGRLVFIGARPAIAPAQGKDLLAYGLSKSLLFKLAEYLNEEAKGKNVTATVVVPSTLDTPLNRKSMPDVNPANWVTPDALAEILAFIVSDTAGALRENVLKVYNNA
ncbi:MAG: family NAD(P)-dependent oxidoreductase [Sediminibacterium sp.]|nr:family NAD(P)-dependent oxidoreductase [Sediminibacterium sp.]